MGRYMSASRPHVVCVRSTSGSVTNKSPTACGRRAPRAHVLLTRAMRPRPTWVKKDVVWPTSTSESGHELAAGGRPALCFCRNQSRIGLGVVAPCLTLSSATSLSMCATAWGPPYNCTKHCPNSWSRSPFNWSTCCVRSQYARHGSWSCPCTIRPNAEAMARSPVDGWADVRNGRTAFFPVLTSPRDWEEGTVRPRGHHRVGVHGPDHFLGVLAVRSSSNGADFQRAQRRPPSRTRARLDSSVQHQPRRRRLPGGVHLFPACSSFIFLHLHGVLQLRPPGHLRCHLATSFGGSLGSLGSYRELVTLKLPPHNYAVRQDSQVFKR